MHCILTVHIIQCVYSVWSVCVHTVYILCVCVLIQEQPWTDARSRESAGRLLSSLVEAGGFRDVPHLLMGDEEESPGGGRGPGVFGGLLDVLQPTLTK